MSMQYAAIFKCAENDHFSCFGFKSGICLLIAPVPVHCFSITFIDDKILIFFIIFAQNIDFGYTLEPPHTSTHYLCFRANKYTPLNPSFTLLEWGRCEGVLITRKSYHDEKMSTCRKK